MVQFDTIFPYRLLEQERSCLWSTFNWGPGAPGFPVLDLVPELSMESLRFESKPAGTIAPAGFVFNSVTVCRFLTCGQYVPGFWAAGTIAQKPLVPGPAGSVH